MKKFTVQEFKNYLLSVDSFGDAVYFLSENKIEEANHNKEIPMYVSLHGTEMRYDKELDEYTRDAGAWNVGYKYLNDVLASDFEYDEVLNEVPLIEITHEEWAEGNGYTSGTSG